LPTAKTTTSTSLRRCAAVFPCSQALQGGRNVRAHVDMVFAVLGEAHRLTFELYAVAVDGLEVVRIGAGKADHAPGNHVAIAAVHRVAEESLHGHFQQHIEEDLRGHAIEIVRP